MAKIPNLFKLFIVLTLSAPSYGVGGPDIDIISAIKALMIPKTANYNSQDKISISEAFEGCIFEPYEIPSCSEREKSSKYPSEKSIKECEELSSKIDFLNQPYHWKTKCNLTHKGRYLVDKNLQRDYRMDVEMHMQEKFVYAVRIGNFDYDHRILKHLPISEYSNHLRDILKDPALTWTPIRCENIENSQFRIRLYLVSAPEKQDLYIDIMEGEDSVDGTRWGALTIYWEFPKSIWPAVTGWTNKCSDGLNGIDIPKEKQHFVGAEAESYYFPEFYTEKVDLDVVLGIKPPKPKTPHATPEEFWDYIKSHTTKFSKTR